MFSSLINFAKRYLKTSDNVTHSSNHSTSPDPEIDNVESLQDRLFHLDLNEKNVAFITEYGDEFVDYPEALAERLLIKVCVAKEALDELKAYKIDQISKEEIQKFELLVKENPQRDPKEIALSHDIHGDVVSAYLAYSETNLLTDSAKATITEKCNNGFLITEIAKQLNISQVKIKDYVESTFITFNGEEGNIILEIISRNFETYPITKLKEMILTKNVKLQDQICCQLLEINKEEYKQLENYFMKFEGSKKFLEIDATLSIEAKNYIRASSLEDIGELSLKLNKMERVIRDYLLRYSQDEEFMVDCAQRQLKQIQEIKANFGTDIQISHTTYRMIISDENLIQNAKHLNGSPKRILDELLPLAFYYIKCSLPLDEFTQIIASITGISLTTLDIFHLIFQMSDPVVRGLCIEHYSFSNPVPFYYALLESHSPEPKCSQFEICKELWYSLQHFSGLVSFGLGWASWNPIGKSHLLDLMFKTDFEKGSPHSSPFHMNSIDIQMTKNLFGKKDKNTQESTEWAYIDCHGYSDINFIGEICQNLDIALIHVSYSDYRENYSRLEEDLTKITASTKDVYVLVRDCLESDNINTEQVILGGKTFRFIFIPNLIQHKINIVSELKKIGYEILHSPIEVPKLVGSNFLENLITRNDSWAKLKEEKELIEWIKNNYANIQDTDKDFSFLSYYPHFVEYMRCFYKASTEPDQKNIDQLNQKSELLEEHLENVEMSAMVWQFNEILARQNSALILWKLSQELNMLSKQLITADNKTPFTLEILWREALLSNKYNVSPDEGKPESKYFGIFSSNFSNHVERGEPFELIDGDNLRFFNQDIDVLLSELYNKQFCDITKNKTKTRAPIVVSIFGPQSSGKSTLLNYCFGCKFLTSAGRCTKGVYASLSKLSQPINHSDHFLILDTEGLDSIEKGKTLKDTSCIHFDRTMVLFCLAVSEVVIINVKGDIGEEMRNLLQICAYSLNKLKVSKVATPKIFFVLNQQADPDPDKHLNSINTLLEKLDDEESYLLDTEELKISDLIQVSKENLFVLPSAFNTESLNTPVANLFDSDLCKLAPTANFANKCTDIRVSIIHQLKNDSDDATGSNNTKHYKVPFNTMSEWLEMSGVIWDTIVKYQDIVKYSNTEEIKCSNKLSIILNDIMKCRIYLNEEEYREITEKIFSEIKAITISSPSNVMLENVKEELSDAFEKYQEKALTDFAQQCEADPLLKKMYYMCEEAKSNLCRLIYMEKKIYEDKLKLEIKARLTEIKHKDNMVKFQQAIEKNADKYLELTIEEKEQEFEKVWVDCFGSFYKEEEEAEFYEKFEDLYSVFRMESKTMENRHITYSQFCDSTLDIDSKIQLLSEVMLSNFCENNNSGTDQFIYPWKENKKPLKEMTPYTGKFKCEYLTSESLFFKKEKKRIFRKTKSKIIFKNWVPRSCNSLIEYCSGYYNHPDIIWKLEKKKQILLLASRLKDPEDPKRSTWEKFLHDISERIQEITERDPDISHSTVKEIVDILCHFCRVVNYEINFIEAKLTNTAERTLSTFAFGLAFKSSLKLKNNKLRENRLIEREKRETNLDYFLQKVENRKLAKGNWDRKKMRDGDKTIANKFARDFLAAVWRKVSTESEHNINERYFVPHRNKLSHKTILLLANEKITEELNKCHKDPINEENIIIQYTCNRTQNLKQLFREEWIKLANELYDKIVENMKEYFAEQIARIKYVLTEFLNDLVANCEKLDRVVDIGSDSDSNFEVANETIELTGNSDPRTGVIPFKAMVSFLELYLDPKVSPKEFEKHFKNEFVVDGVAVKNHHDTYVLFEKPHYATQVLDEDLFKSLTETTMFRSTETIFNIKVYVQEFLRVLNCYEYQVSEAEYGNILKSTREEFEARVINCPQQCPSCGKFCENEIHPHGGRCQIMTGHQICSMGGNVWNTNEDRTAVLLMCEDYQDDTPVLIPGQRMKWWEFKEKCGDQWDWSLPTDEEYVALRDRNREQMKEIWNKFGREILKYYANRGTQITYIPYTTHEKIYEYLFLRYYICFVIDGTDLAGGTINIFKKWISDLMEDTPQGTSCFKVIVYHGHAVNGKKCVDKYPNNSQFTTDARSIQHFLQTISTYGSEGNELPMLHGLATATTESDWKTELGVENVIFHFYIEPTKGHFDVFKARGRINQGRCLFDWKRDIKDKIDNLKINYKHERYVNASHPSFVSCTKFLNHQTPSKYTRNMRKESDPKPSILINYKTDN